jgi:YVTN family beta-propeller protein
MCPNKQYARKLLISLLLINALSIAVSAQPYAYVSNISGNNVSVVNAANNTVVASIPVDASPEGLAVTPNGGLVYVACVGANKVDVISTASNSIIASIPVGASPIQLAITPNGAQVYVVAQANNQVNVIDTGSQTVIANIDVGSHPTRVAFSPDGTRGYVTSLYGGTISVIDVNSKGVIGSFPAGAGPVAVAAASTGRLYVSNQYSNTVTVHDLSGNMLATISGLLFPNAVAVTPDGTRVFVTNGNGATVSTIDTSSNSVIGTLPVGSTPTSVAVSPDGTMAYIVNEFSFSLSQLNVHGNYIASSVPRVGVYPIAVAMQPPASGAPPPPQCTYSLSASSASMSAAGGSGSVNVFAANNCGWSAVSNMGWTQVTGGWSGTGNGIVSFAVNSNSSVNSQSGTLTIAGQTFTISQAGYAPPPPSGGSASFVKADTTTGGSWKGAYGADGYNIFNDSASYPGYVSVTPSGNASYIWSSSSSDGRALQKGLSPTDRVAACWYSWGSFNIDLHFNDANTHQVALYLLDWDNYFGRSERVDILDSNNNVLDSRSVSGFVGGQYLVWNMSGHVTVRIVNLNGNSNAVVSGLLFGPGGGSPSAGTAAFVRTDTTTGGSWQGVYGADGYNVINDTASYPAYVSATPSGNASYIWSSSSGDGRALQKGSSPTDRIAACWYSFGAFSIDLQFNDANTHQVALYLLDWDTYNGGRTERVDILDSNNNLLDSRSVSSFVNGQYLVWNLSGHLTVRITNTNGASNAVLSGIMFR